MPPSSPSRANTDPPLLYRDLLKELLEGLRNNIHPSNTNLAQCTRLLVVDFDNTLFRSPVPSRRLWHTSLLGRLKSPELGWYHHPLTLQEPYVRCRPGDRSWFNPPVLHATRRAIEDPRTLTVLLTGRSRASYQDRIHQLLQTQNLDFDLTLLREPHPDLPNTLSFKVQVLWDILHAFPSIQSLTLWEDRPQQAQEFEDKLREWMSDASVVDWRGRGPLKTGKVVLLDRPSIKYLPPHLERGLVKTLVRDHAQKAQPGTEPIQLCPIPMDASLILPKEAQLSSLIDLLPPGAWEKPGTREGRGPSKAKVDKEEKGSEPHVIPFPFLLLQASWKRMYQQHSISLSILAVGWEGTEAWAWLHLPEWHFTWRHPLARRLRNSISPETEAGGIKVPSTHRGPFQCHSKASFVKGYEGWKAGAPPSPEVLLGQMIRERGLAGLDHRHASRKTLEALRHRQIPLIPPYLPDISAVLDDILPSFFSTNYS
ncbi:hypothetical protein BJ684DRAFT_20857 [Piptocephalis cylindrospora]|uniref:Swiss Army Knife RNA repair protein HAD domain-containing protein n=1 Tax=Piptocephalis cylindrospora TaxID=1907219 RepID=A0A4P9Y3B8_9FUNG|nr:hypothetical protein BJ684DRAFT_20857 [Piptocephalis cylindrospora]|eukprot:RKP12611.1 hypothetical protein BJ684DRAFT_20857 [Piptocephalis cylindrospora]